MKNPSRNEMLIDRLADNVSKNNHYWNDKLEIARQMRYHSLLTYEDVRAINQLIQLVKQMQAEDLDMAHQSESLLSLGSQYANLKKQLLARMNGQRNAFCENHQAKAPA